jgi:hypothetical protein
MTYNKGSYPQRLPQKKIVLIVIIAGLLLGSLVIAWSFRSRYQDDTQLRKELGCDRVTADVRGTGYYCMHLDLYRHDKANNTVLDSDWTKAQAQLKARGLK